MQMQFKLTSNRKLFSSVLNHAFVKLSDERITCMMINSYFLNVKNNRKSDREQYSFLYISVIISTLNLYFRNMMKKEWHAFRNSHTHALEKTSHEMRLTNNQKTRICKAYACKLSSIASRHVQSEKRGMSELINEWK